MRKLDTDNIPGQTLDRVHLIISQESMNPENLANISKAAVDVYYWIVNVVNYGNIIKVLHPLAMAKAVAQDKLKME